MNIFSKKHRSIIPRHHSRHPKFYHKPFPRYAIAASLVALLYVANGAQAVTVSALGEARIYDVTLYRASFGLVELPDGNWGVHALVHYRPHWSRRWRMKNFNIPFSAGIGQFTVRGGDLVLSAGNASVKVAERRSMQPIRWHAVRGSAVSCQETKNGRTLILSNCKLEVN